MKLIDSHVHFWNPHYLRYPWLDEFPTLNQPILPNHIQDGETWSVEKIVFVQPDCLPEQGLAEAMWVASLADNDARIEGIVAFAPLEKGEGTHALLEQLRDIGKVRGVRRLLQNEAMGFSRQPEFIKGVQLLPQYDLSFDICIRHTQFPDVLELVEQCQNVRFVLDHIGKPDIRTGLLEPWRQHINALSAFPNTWCKISGMVTEADWDDWKPADLQPYLEISLEAFGTERVMFGSDSPMLRLARCSYPQWVEIVQEFTASLSADEQHKVFYENAKEFYKL